MLKKFLASLALTVGIIHPSIASEIATGIITEFPCTDLKSVSEVLKKYGEEPAFTGVSTREIAGKFIPISMVIFINNKTKSWTIVEKYSENIYCVSGMGPEISPYFSSKSNTVYRYD